MKTKDNHRKIFTYVATLIVAMCSIIYELLLANEISLAAGNTVVWYSLAIGGYIGFLGIGSLVYARFPGRVKEATKLFWVEIFLSFFGATSVVLVKFSHLFSMFSLMHGFGEKSYVFLFGTAFMLIAIIGFLSGIELPVLMKIAERSNEKKISNRILGFDYFGSLLGTIIFSLFLVPIFNGIQIAGGISLLNFIVAASVLFFYKINILKGREIKKIVVLLVVVSLFLVNAFAVKTQQLLAKKYYYYLQADVSWKTFIGGTNDLPDISRRQSPYQTIDVVEPIEFGYSDLLVNAYIDNEKIPQQPEEFLDKTLYLNGDWQLSTVSERVYHEFFAHVPVQAADLVPEKVLILGGGDGLLLREILKYPDVKKVVQVELDGEMIEVAKEDPSLSFLNEDSFSDPRVELIVDDGFHYLQTNEQEFDAVYIDFPVPFDYNISKLYSYELYSFASRSIKENGFLAMYAPALVEFKNFDEEGWIEVEEEKTPWKQYYNTLKAADFVTILPFYTNLERDEINARTMIEELLAERRDDLGVKLDVKLDQDLVLKKTQEDVDAIMEKFAISMQESFIFAQKKDFEGKFNYVDRGAEYAVMTKRRFFQSFKIKLSKKKDVERRYVNSIMKPTLPITSLWRVRFPYYLE